MLLRVRLHVSPSQVSAAFGLPYAGTAMREAAGKWPVLAGMGKCDGEMCQVGGTPAVTAVASRRGREGAGSSLTLAAGLHMQKDDDVDSGGLQGSPTSQLCSRVPHACLMVPHDSLAP